MASPTPPPPARMLAPMALAGTLAAFIVVVVTSFGGDEAADEGSPPPRVTTATRTTEKGSSERDGSRSESAEDSEGYVVKPGDNLVRIAEKTGVPVETLQELNPDLDPQALVSGQRVKLSEDGTSTTETTTSTTPDLSR